jgi:hypothetical protein
MLLACLASGASRSLRVSPVAALSYFSVSSIDATRARTFYAASASAHHDAIAAATEILDWLLLQVIGQEHLHEPTD